MTIGVPVTGLYNPSLPPPPPDKEQVFPGGIANKPSPIPRAGFAYSGRDLANYLISRYLLTTAPGNIDTAFPLIRTIQPVTNMDEALKSQDIDQQASLAITAVATYNIYTVPAKKKAYIYGLHLLKSSGTWDVYSVTIGDGTHFWYMAYNGAGITLPYYTTFSSPLVLPAGWVVNFYVGAKVANGTADVSAMIQTEDLN